MTQASLTRRTFLIAGICMAAASLSDRLNAQSPDARQIMQQVNSESASKSMVLRASFQVFDHEKQSPKKQFILRSLVSGAASKTLVVFTAPEEIRGVALLSIEQPSQASQQYLYTPAMQRVRSVAPQERSSRFIGTDFSFEEIGKHSVDDFTYRILGDQESIDGHKTYKIEGRPVDASRSQYQYIYYWVAQDVPVIIFEQMYGAATAPIRTLHATDIRRASGIWGARRTEGE